MPKTRIAWWPFALLALGLFAVISLTLAIGAAHAEDGAPSANGESPSKHSAAVAGPSIETGPVATVSHVDPVSTEPSKGAATHRTDPTPNPETGPGTETETETKPETKPPPTAHLTTVRETSSTKPDPTELAPPDVEVSKPTTSSDDDEPATAARSRHRSPPVTRNTALLAPKAAEVSTSRPVTSTTNVVSLPTAQASADPPTAQHQFFDPKFVQFVRQMVGLASDVGIVGASLVNNLAAHTAAFIGPTPFFGVPYAVATAIADTAGSVSKVLSGTPLDATSAGPFEVDYGVMDVLSFFTPTKVPAGANDPSIKISAAHPLPVILLNGTIETQSLNWGVGAPVLANAGYKVYTFNYGNVTTYPNFPLQSTADIRVSAGELSDEIDRVLEATGATKVILVGHSQGGGIMPEYYINEMGGADKVAQLIGISPSNHGTDFNGLVALQKVPILGPLVFAIADLIGPALGQQTVTSPFQQLVYGEGDTRPGVRYTTIASTHDAIVTPYTQQALVGPAVTNIVVQDEYPGLFTGHVGMAFIPQVWDSVLDALAGIPAATPHTVGGLLAA